MSLDRLAEDPRVTVRQRGAPDPDGEAVVYWMQRAQRAADNPALDLAIEIGNLTHKPVIVFLAVNPFVRGANWRHYHFLAEGLNDLADGLRDRRVGFVLRAYPAHRLEPFLSEVRPTLLVGDENPLRQTEQWRDTVANRVRVPFWTVDADVVIPSRLIESEQYAARTIRPRLRRHLQTFLVRRPQKRAQVAWTPRQALSTRPPTPELLDGLPIDRRVSPVESFRGGLSAARARLNAFIHAELDSYADTRNQPDRESTSQLSPYLHFGQIGPCEVALRVAGSGADATSVEAYLEQLIVRRELAVNYVMYNDKYDRLDGCERWGRTTLARHRFDQRPHLYSREQFEAADTHDPLWNAAQRQMVQTGFMHGYIRMYWAKKILEWSATPEEAFETAIELNDRYELDGRDPNGYANIAWAIGGKHDRPWPTRPVFGAIRSMSHASTARKFDSARYIARHAADDVTPLFRESR